MKGKDHGVQTEEGQFLRIMRVYTKKNIKWIWREIKIYLVFLEKKR